MKTRPAKPLHPAIVATAIAILILVAASHSASAQLGPFGGPRPPAAGGIGGWVIAKQAIFYRALAGLIRSAKSDGSAFWALLGISFVYGIFHAAGPGHGKAVISSYLFANEETWRRGVTRDLQRADQSDTYRYPPNAPAIPPTAPAEPKPNVLFPANARHRPLRAPVTIRAPSPSGAVREGVLGSWSATNSPSARTVNNPTAHVDAMKAR